MGLIRLIPEDLLPMSISCASATEQVWREPEFCSLGKMSHGGLPNGRWQGDQTRGSYATCARRRVVASSCVPLRAVSERDGRR